jgi:hypothetical protein
VKRTVTEREAVERERKAYTAGIVAEASRYRTNPPVPAHAAYPLPPDDASEVAVAHPGAPRP